MLLIKTFVVELTEHKRLRTRRTRGQIVELLDQFEKSKMTRAEFCKQHQINVSNFKKWRSRYKTGTVGSTSSPGFARVEIVSPAAPASLFAEVNGIRIYQPVSAAFLKALVK